MTDNEKGRNIRFPVEVRDAVDEEAQRCKRSAQKQLEALLTAYYELGNIELNYEKLSSLKSKPSGKTKEVIDIDKQKDKKKKTG